MMLNLLLLGNTGQLGWELERSLGPLGQVTALDYPEIDLAHPESLRPVIRQARPQVIVNATAYTAVDRAENEAGLARAINAAAPGVMAEEARRLGAALLHYSTDYVFDGSKGSPYVETDTPQPLGMYGQSKLEGEQAVAAAGGTTLILRTSWVYSLRRPSFVTKVLEWARQQETLRLVDDQISNPTWARFLAEISAQVLAGAAHAAPGDPVGWLAARGGLYHLAGSGYASRLEWGQAVLRHDPRAGEQKVRVVLPSSTADFPTPARRPLFSALDCTKFSSVFALCLPPWEEALRLAMQNN